MAQRAFAVLVLVLTAMAAGSAPSFARAEVISVHLAPSGDADGSGIAVLRFDPDAGRVCYTIVARDIGAPQEPAPGIGSAHIHGPLPAGGIAIDLDTVFRTTGTDTYVSNGCVAAGRAAIDAVLVNPERYYINVHNAQFPGGAVQGNLAG